MLLLMPATADSEGRPAAGTRAFLQAFRQGFALLPSACPFPLARPSRKEWIGGRQGRQTRSKCPPWLRFGSSTTPHRAAAGRFSLENSNADGIKVYMKRDLNVFLQ